MFNTIKNLSRFVRLGNLLRQKPHKNAVIGAHIIRNLNLCRYFCTESALDGPNLAAITNGDKDLEHKLKVLILEVDVMRQEGKLVPDNRYLRDQDWHELLKLPTISARRRFLEFLFKIAKKKENRQMKKEEKRLELLSTKPEKPENETLEEFVLKYDLQHNNLFLRVYDTTINQMYNNRLVQAMQFGQKLVVDCGFDQQMVARENKNCAKQLMLLFAENRSHDDPFDLHFCNINRDSILIKTLHKFIATMYEPCFPLHLHEPSYLEKFPKEQLVYLTPHCREELLQYDHDAIYIIGGIVDVMNNNPLSLAKAKKEGVRMAKLPLDRYLQWGSGSGKSLTLNQVAAILLDMKVTGDWKYALRHVPKRKIVDYTVKKQTDQQADGQWRSARVNFGKLSFNNKKNQERRSRVRSIMYD